MKAKRNRFREESWKLGEMEAAFEVGRFLSVGKKM